MTADTVGRRIREALKGATSGPPWSEHFIGPGDNYDLVPTGIEALPVARELTEADAMLLAMLRNEVPALLEKLERYEEALKQAICDMEWAESKGANFRSAVLRAQAALRDGGAS